MKEVGKRIIYTLQNIERVKIPFTKCPKDTSNPQSLVLKISKGSLDRIF